VTELTIGTEVGTGSPPRPVARRSAEPGGSAIRLRLSNPLSPSTACVRRCGVIVRERLNKVASDFTP